MEHKFLCLLPIPALLSGLTACTTVEERERPMPDRAPYYEPRPAYSDYDYYFYPNVAVYFQISTGYYFYEDHGHWVRVRQLPPHIHLDARYRRHLIIREPMPYQRYNEHARLYGGRDDDRDRDRDRRDGGRPDRDARPLPPYGDRPDRGPERPAAAERPYGPPAQYPKPEERREPPPLENRGLEHRHQGIPGRGPDDDRRGPPTQGTPREDDKPQGNDRDRSRDGRPDVRVPAKGDVPSQQAHGREERGDSREAGRAGDPGGKGRSPGGRDDDDEDRDRRSPGPR